MPKRIAALEEANITYAGEYNAVLVPNIMRSETDVSSLVTYPAPVLPWPLFDRPVPSAPS